MEKEQVKVDEDFKHLEDAVDDGVQQEKDLVPLFDAINPNFFDSNCSQWWKFSLHVDWMKLEHFYLENDDNLSNMGGLQKIIKQLKIFVAVGKNPVPLDSSPSKLAKLSKERFGKLCRKCVICPLCFFDKKKTLSESVILCGSLRPSNISSHCDKKHKDFKL